jgi:glycosyltransferase involved in cell wall biosynthesis
MSLVSILTPFKNAEKYILQTAESIFAQDYSDWEWILINDHSQEKEIHVLAPYLRDKRVLIMENDGKGIISALQKGLHLAKGEFITRMDADDLMPPKKLSLFVKELTCGSGEIVTGKVSYFASDGKVSKGYQDYENWLNKRVDESDHFDQVYRECSVASANWLMRKKDLLSCGGFDGLVYPEDYDLLFRWYQHEFNITSLKEITHFWREHPERTSRNSLDYAQDRFFELKVNRFLEIDYKGENLILNGTGRKGRLTAKILLDKDVPFSWVSIEPEKFKAGLYGQKILGHEEVRFGDTIVVLNVAKIEKEIVLRLYEKKNRIKRVITF